MDHEHRGTAARVGDQGPQDPQRPPPGASPPAAFPPAPAPGSGPGFRAPAARDRIGILVINEYGEDEREFRIIQDQVRIGRDPRGQIVLRDAGVSRAHVLIQHRGEDYLLEDLGSRNGTSLNDRPLPARGATPLRHGDAIQIGRCVLRFILSLGPRPTTGLIDTGEVPGLEAAPEKGPDRKDALSLFRLQNLEAGLLVAGSGLPAVRFPIESDRITVGRNPASDIVLSDPTVSMDHAEIVYNKDGFHIVDLRSTLGTFLDGVSVRIGRLQQGSFLRLGKQTALFTIHQKGWEPPDPPLRLRDFLAELFPERTHRIQETFQRCRELALDFAEELVLGGVLLPEEWWAANSEYPKRSSSGTRGWLARLFHR